MFTEIEALLVIKFLKEQRDEVCKMVPDAGPAQVAYFTLVRASVTLALDAKMNGSDVLKEIVPQPTELIL